MGNEQSSSKNKSSRTGDGTGGTTSSTGTNKRGNPAATGARDGKRVDSKESSNTIGGKKVQISPAADATTNKSPGSTKNKINMEESAHTFAPNPAATNPSKDYKGKPPVMITDALSDVRVNYHIDPKELGHGHYGVVRKCMHRESGNWYAIKSIRKSKVSKIEVLKREIEILKEVKHPNIIELIEVYEDERYLHLITELCTGGELFDRIIAKTQSTEGHFSEHDAAVLVNDILDAIRYCHDEKGIVHRDLKPENFLFLTSSDTAPVKIIDFGLSRHDDADLGIMQTKVGTPYYVAPEVLRREYTNMCDIWSIGVITYILLCGYPPFYGDSDTQIFESVRVGKFDFPSPEWDDISQSAKDFVILLLKKDPNRRPAAAEAMKHRWLKEQLGFDNEKNKNSTDAARDVKMKLSHKSNRTGEFTNYLAMKKLKKAAFGYIASNLTQAEVGALEEQFKTLDQNHDGYITLTELDEAISQGTLNQNVIHGVRRLRSDLALGESNKLNWRDFLAMTMDRSLAVREDNIKTAFEHFKHTDADSLTVEDLAEIFGGETKQAQEIVDLLDSNGDGKISFEDFKHALVESINEDENEDKQEENGGGNNAESSDDAMSIDA